MELETSSRQDGPTNATRGSSSYGLSNRGLSDRIRSTVGRSVFNCPTVDCPTAFDPRSDDPCSIVRPWIVRPHSIHCRTIRVQLSRVLFQVLQGIKTSSEIKQSECHLFCICYVSCRSGSGSPRTTRDGPYVTNTYARAVRFPIALRARADVWWAVRVHGCPCVRVFEAGYHKKR